MTASEPTILATSGGYRYGDQPMVRFDALVHHAVELSGVTGRRPRVMYVGTAIGDAEHFAARIEVLNEFLGGRPAEAQEYRVA